VVGTLPAVLVGFVEFQSLGIVVKVLIVFGVVQFLDNNIIQPVVVSRGVNIHPLVVVFAVMAGAELGGVLGMFLAVPVACMVKILVQVFARRLKLA
jgi:predicted PurR-regulated permease PerM